MRCPNLYAHAQCVHLQGHTGRHKYPEPYQPRLGEVKTSTEDGGIVWKSPPPQIVRAGDPASFIIVEHEDGTVSEVSVAYEDGLTVRVSPARDVGYCVTVNDEDVAYELPAEPPPTAGAEAYRQAAEETSIAQRRQEAVSKALASLPPQKYRGPGAQHNEFYDAVNEERL